MTWLCLNRCRLSDTSHLSPTHLHLPTTTSLSFMRAQLLGSCSHPSCELIQLQIQTAVLGKVRGQPRLEVKVCFPRHLSLLNSPLHGGAQGPLPLWSVGHPLLLILPLKLRAILNVARLSRLPAKLRHFALEVYINAISKPVITLLNMWPWTQAWVFSVWVILSVDCI